MKRWHHNKLQKVVLNWHFEAKQEVKAEWEESYNMVIEKETVFK